MNTMPVFLHGLPWKQDAAGQSASFEPKAYGAFASASNRIFRQNCQSAMPIFRRPSERAESSGSYTSIPFREEARRGLNSYFP
jgi:hypothetical protein